MIALLVLIDFIEMGVDFYARFLMFVFLLRGRDGVKMFDSGFAWGGGEEIHLKTCI